MPLLALGAAFILAYVLRARRVLGLVAIPLAVLLAPLGLAFETFVYPADPEYQMWWQIAAATGTAYGLIAAGLGYVCAAVIQKRRGA